MLRVAALPADARASSSWSSVVPGRAELWLLAGAVGRRAIDACIGGRAARAAAATRSRSATTSPGAPSRRRSRPLRRRRAQRDGAARARGAPGADLARLAHHADGAGDADAIRRWAPAAARAAAAAGGHRAGARALGGGAGGRGRRRRRGARGRRDRGVPVRAPGARARGAPRAARAARGGGDALATGDEPALAVAPAVVDGPRRGGGRVGRPGDRAARGAAADEPRAGDGAQRPARSSRCSPSRDAEAIALGTRAIDLARRLGDRETLAHALTNVGTVRVGRAEHERGRAQLEEAFALAVAAGQHDHAARALVNLATATLRAPAATTRASARDLERGLRFAARARARRLRAVPARRRAPTCGCCTAPGRRPRPTRAPSLALGEQFGVSLCPALVALGRLQARRGEPEAGATLDEAWRRAVKTGGAAAARPRRGGARRARLARRRPRADGRDRAPTPTRSPSRAATCGRARELAFWLWRARRAGDPPPDGAADAATRRSIAGDWRGAAAAVGRARLPLRGGRRAQRGRRRGGAARGAGDVRPARRRAPARRLRRRLRADGMRRIPRGPRPPRAPRRPA